MTQKKKTAEEITDYPSKIKNMETNDEKNPFDLEKLADQEVYKEYPATTHNWYAKQREGFFNGFIKGYRHASQKVEELVAKSEPEAAGQEQEEGDTAHWMKKYEAASQHTASLQKQVEELREEKERIRKILRDILEVDNMYRARGINTPAWVKSMIDQALNPLR